MSRYHALMPDSRLSAQRIDDSLKVIRGFENVNNVSELTSLQGRTMMALLKTPKSRQQRRELR